MRCGGNHLEVANGPQVTISDANCESWCSAPGPASNKQTVHLDRHSSSIWPFKAQTLSLRAWHFPPLMQCKLLYTLPHPEISNPSTYSLRCDIRLRRRFMWQKSMTIWILCHMVNLVYCLCLWMSIWLFVDCRFLWIWIVDCRWEYICGIVDISCNSPGLCCPRSVPHCKPNILPLSVDGGWLFFQT